MHIPALEADSQFKAVRNITKHLRHSKSGMFGNGNQIERIKMSEIKPLPPSLHRKGIYYSLVKRTGEVAIYSLCYSQGVRIIGFDVFWVFSSTWTLFGHSEG
jgi:hypothetical protein